MINKADFIKEYALLLCVSEKEAQIKYETFLNVLKNFLAEGEEVRFLNFGSFQLIKEAQKNKGAFEADRIRLEFRPSKSFLDSLEAFDDTAGISE